MFVCVCTWTAQFKHEKHHSMYNSSNKKEMKLYDGFSIHRDFKNHVCVAAILQLWHVFVVTIL